jgi:hypothetical protein
MSKKSETIEVRLAYETKLAFMARCRADGVSASETLRRFIAEMLENAAARRARRRRRAVRVGLAIAAATAVAAAAEPTLARAVASTALCRQLAAEPTDVSPSARAQR